MIFKAKIVGTNKRMRAILTLAVSLFIPLLFCLFTPSLKQYSAFVFAIIIFIAFFGAFFNKGGPSLYTLNKEIVVHEDHLEIATIMFPFEEVKELLFHFQSFQNMCKGRYETDPDAELKRTDGIKVYGLENTISFMYKNQTFKYNFYMENQAHFFEFVQMLECLYTAHINFQEENWYGKTFLMQNVNKADYDNLLANY